MQNSPSKYEESKMLYVPFKSAAFSSLINDSWYSRLFSSSSEYFHSLLFTTAVWKRLGIKINHEIYEEKQTCLFLTSVTEMYGHG